MFQHRAERLRAGAGQDSTSSASRSCPRRLARSHRSGDPPHVDDRAGAAGREGSGRVPRPVDRRLHQAPNAGIVFFRLKDFREAQARRADRRRDRRRAQPAVRRDPGRFIRCSRRRRCMGLGTIGGFKLMIEDRADLGYDALYEATQEVLNKARASGAINLRGVFSSYQINVPQLVPTSTASRPSAGRCAHRRVRDDADLSRLALRQRLQPLRPHLPGHRAGRRAVPLARRGHRAAQDAQRTRRDGAARLAAEGRSRAIGPTA